jgi:homoserine dehydrogenase
MDPIADKPVVRRVALVGLGSVGRALAGLVAERHAQTVAELGVDLRITGVMTRTLGLVDDADGLDLAELARGAASGGTAYDVDGVGAWLERSHADVLVEASVVDLDSGQPATDFLREALRRGIHGVTANKGPVVHAYRELTALGAEHGARFRFEAATADCLPIYNLYREALPLDRPHRFRGMVNGTTTVILETIEAGGTYDDGVAEAQRRGIAEADPSLDVDGYDAAVKVIAIANVLMGAELGLGDIDVTGIRDLDVAEVREAARVGTPIRLVAEIERVEGAVLARVAPERLDARDPFVRVGGDDLAVHFDGDLMPGITVVGHGLTPRETAYGVLSDIVGVLRGR